jgi:RNA polymerase sigma-70 factor (ECF subfamily)
MPAVSISPTAHLPSHRQFPVRAPRGAGSPGSRDRRERDSLGGRADGIIGGRTGPVVDPGEGGARTVCAVISHVLDRPVDARPPGRSTVVEVVVSARDMEDARDRELLRKVRDGDPEGSAFRELFRRNAGVAKTVALRVTRSAELAEEAVQEGFLQLWRAPERFDASKATVRRWLLTLVHARAVDLVRREQAQRRRAEEAAGEPMVQLDPADDVVAAVARPGEQASVRAALETLPPEQRDVIELMYLRGVSQTGIAESLGLPLGTVKSRALLAMRKLRNALAEAER